MKIIGWNINHRLGYAKANMPTWVKDVIQEKSADIIVVLCQVLVQVKFGLFL